MNYRESIDNKSYLTQSQKHRNMLGSILKELGNNNIVSEFQGILTDDFGNVYKISERESDYPDFYLDNSTYNRLKKQMKSRKSAYYVVVVQDVAYIFDILKHKYEVHSQFVNKNTFEKKSKTVKKVREFHKWQRDKLININQIKTTIPQITTKKVTGLFQ